MKYSEALMPVTGSVKRSGAKNTDTLIAVLFAAFAAAHVISWLRIPWLAVTGRLSTSPVVVALCCAGFAAARVRDWRLARFVSLAAVTVLAAGRFTFHILGGAPPFTGMNLFEVRCISELLVLILIAALCLRHPLDKTGRRVLYTALLGFLSDAYDTPSFPLRKVRAAELLLCGMTIGFWFTSGNYGGILMLNAGLLVLWAMMVSGERNNGNVAGIIMIMKTIADLNEPSYLFTRELFVMIIIFDCAATILAFLGRREDFSLVLIIQLMMVLASFILFCCITVDRDSPYFVNSAAAWGCEWTLYMNFLLLGFGLGWSRDSLGAVLHSMFEWEDEQPDDDGDSVQESAYSDENLRRDQIEASVAKGLSAYRTRKAILYLAVTVIAAISISSIAGTYVSGSDVTTDRAGKAVDAETYLTWSEDRTIAAHYDIFREALYGPESDLTYEKRMEFFEAAVDVESNYLCIPYAITVRADTLNEGDVTKTAAHFNFSKRTITVDETYLAEADPWELMETAAHEVFHAWQYEAVLLDEVVKDERSRVFLHDQLSTVEEYKKELTDYEEDGLEYYSQTVEKEARNYAEGSVADVKKRMQELAERGE